MSEKEETPTINDNLELELGDIIEIIAPTNPEIHEVSFFVHYIDDEFIKLINISNREHKNLYITESGDLSDESIQHVNLLSRSEEPGFAKQHNLLINTWVELYFSGVVSTTVTGEITDLINDQIEITTYPDLDIIYIDFEYKGLPKHLPLEKIIIRPKPAGLDSLKGLSKEDLDEDEETQKPNEEMVEYLENGESINHLPDDAEADENIRDTLRSAYTKANNIIFGSRLEEIQLIHELPENQRRYGIETQTNSLLDELLSTIPTSQRTDSILNKIHMMIERFKELREDFSIFDESGDVIRAKIHDENFHKPLIEHISNMDTKLRWLVPTSFINKKIYEDVTADDKIHTISENDNDITLIQDKHVLDVYNNMYNYNNEGNNIYISKTQELSNIFTPFNDTTRRDYIDQRLVEADIESILTNLDNFESSVLKGSLKQMEIVKRKFIIQKYCLNMTKLVKEMVDGKERAIVRPLYKNDKIAVKSFISMPMCVMKFSAIDMPGTSLYEKTKLHRDFFMISRVLRKNTRILPKVIEDFKKEIDYDDKENESSFLQNISEYILDEHIEDPNKYHKFLKVIIPNTWMLIKITRKYLQYDLSFKNAVDILEPFLVYSNDITYPQYKQIRHFLKERIKELKKEIESSGEEFDKYKNEKYHINREPLLIIRLLLEKEDVLKKCLTGYKLPNRELLEENYSSQEILKFMLDFDNGVLLTQLIASLLTSLMTPNNLATILEEGSSEQYDETDKNEKIKAKDCNQRVLTKKYSSVVDLQKDNHNDEVYYDEEFDDTPYYIMEKYKQQQKEKLPEKFPGWLKEILVEKHDCPESMAKEMAERLIANKRKVEEGEYALLEVTPKLPKNIDMDDLSEKEREKVEQESDVRKKIKFFQRKKGYWVEDKDIDEESFMDSSTLFCNLSKKCFQNIKNPITGNDCETTKDAEKRMGELLRKKALKEFDRRYELSKEDNIENLEKQIIKHMKYIHRLNALNHTELYKYNNIAYHIGLGVRTIDENIIRSPYLKLKDNIMSQSDFSKKQHDILKFYEKFCREPRTTEDFKEDYYFKYCRETDTKLIASFHIILAQAYVLYGETEYANTLDIVCAERGRLSENGDAIIDKFGSGEEICKIDNVEEQQFTEEGFRVSTNAVMEKDTSEVILEKLKSKKAKVFENEKMEEIYRIYIALATNIGVPLNDFEDKVLRLSYELCSKNIVDKEEYEEYIKQTKAKTGKTPVSYAKKKNKTMIQIIASVLLVNIQTTIPSFQTKKTFPGCIRSFDGFPLTGPENIEGLQYLGCVIDKMKASYEPWDSIGKTGATVLTDQLRTIVDSIVMKDNEIDEMYLKKREYMLNHPIREIPDDYVIEKWRHFMPPLIDTNIIKGLKSVAQDFSKEYMELLRSGKKDQHKDFMVLKSKVSYYSYGIMEAIQELINKKDLLLKTSGNEPFLQNACCNDNETNNPIYYFIEENQSIDHYVRVIKSLSGLIEYTNKLSRATLLVHESKLSVNTKTLLPKDPIEENIYLAFIHYCGLDKGLPIPEKYHAYFQEIPIGYDPKASLEEKISFLKRDAHKNFSLEDYLNFMQIVSQSNIIEIVDTSIEETVKYDAVGSLKDILNVLEKQELSFSSEEFIELMRGVLDKYKENKMYLYDPSSADNDDEGVQKHYALSMRKLKDYLAEENLRKYEAIMRFLNKNGEMRNRDYDKLHDYFNELTKWELDKDKNQYCDEGMYTIVNYMRNFVYNMTHLYPNLIIHEKVNNNRVFDKYWGLGENDANEIRENINKYYDQFKPFFSDIGLERFLREMQRRLKDVRLFIDVLPIFNSIHKKEHVFYSLFDKSTLYMLMNYVLYSVVHEYIEGANNNELLTQDIQEQKQERRQAIKDNNDPALSNYETSYENIDMDENEEVYNEMAEVHIEMGNRDEFKKRVGSMLKVFLEIAMNNKSIFNFEYSSIIEKTHKYKQKEKSRIVERLRSMSIEERRVENMKKTYKLGEWNVGQNKGLFVYDVTTSDRERTENILQGFVDIDTEIQEETDYDENMEDENEALNINGLSENYMDGQYYSEDEEEF